MCWSLIISKPDTDIAMDGREERKWVWIEWESCATVERVELESESALGWDTPTFPRSRHQHSVT